jgi:predicted GH43/DUF377 family glycosyl hydrolase
MLPAASRQDHLIEKWKKKRPGWKWRHFLFRKWMREIKMENYRDYLDPLATRRFIQIPGPNPIVVRGGPGEWDEECVEGGDIFKDYTEDKEVYYLYFHAVARDKSTWPGDFRIGVAAATHPLGPFTKVPQNPILEPGPKGSWDDGSVACPTILKIGPDKYMMWYSGIGTGHEHPHWSIGIATASHPLGPWERYEGNPILEDFGYMGGVVQVDGKYYMYNAYPINSFSPDYSPFALATATDPYGPWERYEGNPILTPSGWGAWDDGGYSEAKVVYRDGVFHTFYGGCKQHPMRIRSLESIGYAFSRDGYHFTKHVDNPVALREKNPDASAFAEVQCLFEPPFIYLYHTHRYLSSEAPDVEDLGVQVLAMGTPFKLSMPVLHMDTLAAGATTELAACPPISLENICDLALGVRCAYDAEATAGVRVHVRASYDGFAYDTEDWATFDNGFAAGQEAGRTVEISAKPQFIKVMVENLDPDHSVTGLTVTATLGS